MYTEFYGLKEKPFKLTPDPAFLFLSETHAEALNHLSYGISNSEGFILITGDVGSGKTTLCRILLEKLGSDVNSALIFNPMLSEEELLRAMLHDFGVESKGQTKKELVDELNAFLLEQLAEGRKTVLIIDEAQNLSVPMLEQIRLLSNLETDKEKLIQIILLGQNELRDKLNLPALRQLKQRITVWYALGYLNRAETEQYVYHRLTVSGSEGRIQFSRRALDGVFGFSKGAPRLINVVADRALLGGYMQTTNKISRKLVDNGIKSLQSQERAASHVRWRMVALFSIPVIVSGLFLLYQALGK